VWIYQELLLSHRSIVVVGGARMTWENFYNAIQIWTGFLAMEFVRELAPLEHFELVKVYTSDLYSLFVHWILQKYPTTRTSLGFSLPQLVLSTSHL
jgi:hypothetical protein